MSGPVREAHLSLGERALRVFSKAMVKCVQRPKVYGPKPDLTAPTIFVGRHVGLMDPVILMVEYYHNMLHPLAATDYVDKNRFTKFFFTHAQCIPIDRKNKSKQWLEDSMSALSKGESIIIYPEGKRNKTGVGMLPFHVGAAVLAAHSGAQLIPVYNQFWNFPGRYRLAIGEPFHIDAMPAEGLSSEWLHAQTDKIEAAVAALEGRF